jgi:hypothetical protein
MRDIARDELYSVHELSLYFLGLPCFLETMTLNTKLFISHFPAYNFDKFISV